MAGRGAASNVKGQGEGWCSSPHHHYNNYYYYWCKESVSRPLWNPTKNSSPVCCSHFHSFLSLFLHYHYRHYDRSRRYYPNCPRHHRNVMQLMTTFKMWREGDFNAGINNANGPVRDAGAAHLARKRRTERTETTSPILMSQTGGALATSEGTRDSIRLSIVTDAPVPLYHPYKQPLCQAHYRATTDFIS